MNQESRKRGRARYLKIRGQRWRVIFGRPPRNYCQGLCDRDRRTIWIAKGADDPIATLIHELLHACFWDLDESAVEEAEDALIKGLELVS